MKFGGPPKGVDGWGRLGVVLQIEGCRFRIPTGCVSGTCIGVGVNSLMVEDSSPLGRPHFMINSLNSGYEKVQDSNSKI